MADLKVLAERFGIEHRQHETSHVTFFYACGLLTLPAARPIKRVYVRWSVELIDRREGSRRQKLDLDTYPFTIRPLSCADGGPHLIEYPDVPGCISDGATPEEAIANGRDALKSALLTMKEFGVAVPQPTETKGASGQWWRRAPKSLHNRLVARAKQEGVSLNTLVVTMIAEGLGKRKAR